MFMLIATIVSLAHVPRHLIHDDCLCYAQIDSESMYMFFIAVPNSLIIAIILL